MKEFESRQGKLESISCDSNKESIPELEKDLRKRISDKRKSEMDRYGRTEIYDQISEFLQGNRREAFSLVNHALAIIDDKIDVGGGEEQLEKAKTILDQGFQKKEAEIAEAWQGDVFELGQTLARLREGGFAHAMAIFDEVINYWEIEIKNLNRKGKVLSSNDLDNLNLEIGKSVGLQFLYLLCPNLNEGPRESLASSYGFAVKSADNLSDLNGDFKEGYINISREDIEKHGLDISNLNKNDLRLYKETELKKIRRYYKKADEIVDKILKEYPSQRKGILLFKDISESWLKQVEESCFIEDLKQLDIANHATPKFLSTKELSEMESSHNIVLADIIALSYEQEARNTQLVREKDVSYSPYFHEKTPQANKIIKELVDKHPEIKDVLDLGCDDGSKTAELFEGKKLYGMEAVEDSAEKARKRGVKVYKGSIINDLYKDQSHLNGREFDLVSIMGEMVNFVGLDTNALLTNAIRQIKDKGYLLVSCMHSKFDKTQEGNYVVWSFTESTKDRWELKETKIPRIFCLISKQGLENRLGDISQPQNCHLILKEEGAVKNYYGDMRLGIYILQKNLNQ